MKTTEKILKSTKLKYREYDAWRFNNFIDWCYRVAESHFMNAPQLIKHDGLFNWYCDMWLLHVEKQFVKDNDSLLEMNAPDQVQEILLTYPDAILEMRPEPLLKMIRTSFKNQPKPEYESK
ncbi:MAG: hypothetical protein ABGW97_15865 [Christiangramia sp.]|uniref:hypothetical protein n=1 Tax=Christiangramia sp. TaxID=1931228 RepID=UPI0032426084